MATEALSEATEPDQPESQEPGKRDKSTIQFPYVPLEEAVAIAKGVYSVGGSSCQVDQLAAHLNQKPNTGSFRLKLGTTKMFGLITYSMGTVTLTPLGSRLCDPQQEQAAKAEAFLLIPLYQKVYEQFKGVNLPPLAGLETAMVNMGVAPKQKGTARQVFHRSATFAGFFWSGAGRLVYPKIKGCASGASVQPNEANGSTIEIAPEKQRKDGGGAGGGGGDQHPFIQGLIKELPEPKSEWAIDARKKWLQAASNIFDLIYETPDDGRGSLKIEIQKETVR